MNYLELLREQFNHHVDFRERRPGIIQLVAPLYHEDGDMVDIFLEPAKENERRIRICDHGMTLMRLSYTFDLDTPNKERIFQRILSENRIKEEDGNLVLEAPPEGLYPAVLQFAQAVSKVSNMELYKREVIQSLFMEMLTEFIEKELARFRPRANALPLVDRDDLEVDFAFDVQPRPIYLFGSKDTAKARLAAISCLEFLRAGLGFTSAVVHEDFDVLPKKDRSRITSAADKQFISLADFQENGPRYFQRESVN